MAYRVARTVGNARRRLRQRQYQQRRVVRDATDYDADRRYNKPDHNERHDRAVYVLQRPHDAGDRFARYQLPGAYRDPKWDHEHAWATDRRLDVVHARSRQHDHSILIVNGWRVGADDDQLAKRVVLE